MLIYFNEKWEKSMDAVKNQLTPSSTCCSSEPAEAVTSEAVTCCSSEPAGAVTSEAVTCCSSETAAAVTCCSS